MPISFKRWEYANQTIKEKLKDSPCDKLPLLPIPLELETDVSTDEEYNDIQNECNAYVSRFEGMLLRVSTEMRQ